MPKDQRPNFNVISSNIQAKSHITYFPIDAIPAGITPLSDHSSPTRPIHIVWNHRWEWDKGYESLFKVLYKLAGITDSSSQPSTEQITSPSDVISSNTTPSFIISVIGESFGEVPVEFEKAQKLLAPYIKYWGYMESKLLYFHVLKDADVVISTALHEFFGVSIIEAILCGCYPICPSRLVFPEYLPEQHLYKTDDQLAKKLRYFIKYPEKVRQMEWKSELKLDRFSWASFERNVRLILEEPK